MSTPVFIHKASAVCALGNDVGDITKGLFSETLTSPLQPSTELSAPISESTGPETSSPENVAGVYIGSSHIENYDESLSRNDNLLLQVISPLRDTVATFSERYGSHRIGVLVGSSTSGIADGEIALKNYSQEHGFIGGYHYQQQEVGAPARFVARQLNLDGPAWSISTACTSGAKALATARRLINSGICDAVVAGGGDSLCKLTIQGFSALGAMSPGICNPFSRNRNGINIGEAAALFILSREPADIALLASGETSDAHHISAPDPQAKGAITAMQQALNSASLKPTDIGYVNLHGTATQQNDAMESQAVNQVLGKEVPCSSTKPLTGHTLGAAGALEAYFCYLALQRDDGMLPGQYGDGIYDTELPLINILYQSRERIPLQYAMSNSFAFGGNNISLLLGRADG